MRASHQPTDLAGENELSASLPSRCKRAGLRPTMFSSLKQRRETLMEPLIKNKAWKQPSISWAGVSRSWQGGEEGASGVVEAWRSVSNKFLKRKIYGAYVCKPRNCPKGQIRLGPAIWPRTPQCEGDELHTSTECGITPPSGAQSC